MTQGTIDIVPIWPLILWNTVKKWGTHWYYGPYVHWYCSCYIEPTISTCWYCDPVSQIETWPLILWPYGPLILWPLHGTYNINMLILWPCDPIWNLAKIWPKFDHWYSGPMDHWYCGLGQRATIKVWYCGLVAIDIVHLLILWNSPKNMPQFGLREARSICS